MIIYKFIKALGAKDRDPLATECVFIKLFQNTGDFDKFMYRLVQMGFLFASSRDQLAPFCFLVSPESCSTVLWRIIVSDTLTS